MKKTLVSIMIVSLFFASGAFSAVITTATETVVPSKMTEIQQKIQDKMDKINKDDKTVAPVAKEIIVEKNIVKPVLEVAPVAVTPKVFDMGTLAAMNIIGGLFEGGLIGAGCGLIGYSKNMNLNTQPLVTGTLAGMFTGMTLGAALSIYQANSKRYSASDDFGYDIVGGTILGILLGSAGGFISYGKTHDLENVSEVIGYGVAIGAGLGLVLGVVETFIPEQYRGTTEKLKAMNIQNLNGSTVLSCNIKF
ncbi:MAG: hypothetical protein WCJ94_04625 [bacterium]